MDNMHRDAAEVVKNYFYHLDEIGSWYGYTSEQISIAKWTAEEIVMLLVNEPLSTPINTIDRFRAKLTGCSRLNSNTSNMFAAASDAAADILDQLMA